MLSQTDRVPFARLPMQHLMTEISAIEQQYRMIIHVYWASESAFHEDIPVDSVAFWVEIANYSLSNDNPFLQLATYAFTCLSTPVSNAVCERIFSQVTSVKTKLRSRMESEMLDAIIRIRTTLKFIGMCCKNFCGAEEMLELFNSSNLYERKEKTAETDEVINISDFI